jgi:hypothetical protein
VNRCSRGQSRVFQPITREKSDYNLAAQTVTLVFATERNGNCRRLARKLREQNESGGCRVADAA